MGAVFLEMMKPGEMAVGALQSYYATLCDQAATEDGNSYSGNWNMCPGLRVEQRHFADVAEARAYVEEHAQKWEAALAVKATHIERKPATYDGKPGGGGEVGWWDWSSNVPIVCDQLTASEQTRVLDLLPKLRLAEAVARRHEQALRDLGSLIGSVAVELPADLTLASIRQARQTVKRADAEAEKLRKQVAPLQAALTARLTRAGKTQDVWFIGGWAAM
jgi:hypothetical protein